jgi:hypothetical protein
MEFILAHERICRLRLIGGFFNTTLIFIHISIEEKLVKIKYRS